MRVSSAGLRVEFVMLAPLREGQPLDALLRAEDGRAADQLSVDVLGLFLMRLPS